MYYVKKMELDGLPSTITPPAVTLTFDLSIRIPNKYVSWPRCIM